ncbi:acyl carrier protein [Falsiroseomonas sp. HW251]|uniref:acyl carrier protein n=1 Tax=Falsiroseomonas sp. HW251 TaxID=3390998 RepID=UPI003D30F2DC
MAPGNVYERVRDVIASVKAEVAPVRPEQIGPASRLDAMPLAMDSVDLVKMIVGLEEAFDLVVEPGEMLDAPMETVADVVRSVERLLGHAA